MKTQDLLKMMNKEQLLDIVNTQSIELDRVKFIAEEDDKVVTNLKAEISLLKTDFEKQERMSRHHKRMRVKLQNCIDSIASQFNRSLGCVSKDEIINLKSQSNIKDRLNDILDINKENKFITNDVFLNK